MSKKDNKKLRRNKNLDLFSNSVKTEKDKARKLRQTPWWKKKISDGICYYCGDSFAADELTMDHKIPLSRGGMTEKINIVAACKDCNNKKKYLLPTEWEEYLQRIKTS